MPPERIIQDFRKEFPTPCSTARAIGEHADWNTIVRQAVAYGYVEEAHLFSDLIEAVLVRR